MVFSLRQHIQCIHEGIKFKCELCDYEANEKKMLKTHVKVQHENFRFTCDQCSLEFATPQGLRMHKKADHEGIRYDCSQCSYQAVLRIRKQVQIKKCRFGANLKKKCGSGSYI